MELHSALNEVLGIRVPIVLAPMGGAAGAALAGAVSSAGGLGLIGGGYADKDWVERELAAADLSLVGVGFITWSLRGREAVYERALERRPRALFFSFGDPAAFLPAAKAAGAKVMCQVQTVADAQRAAQLGADVIVAQGAEAGGHGAARGTMALVPAVVDAVAPLPVLAAGGIADGRGIAAALMLGAQGAVVGTRFLATPEALIHANAKARIVASSGDDTLRTRVFDIVRGRDWPKAYTGRAIRNAFTERWHGDEDGLAKAVQVEQPKFLAALGRGDVDNGLIFAGEALDLIQGEMSAARIVEELVKETVAALRGAANLVRP
ncbi:MAG: NAD(P)H-dependent flavin oxidoreductase [SAR324 cluster bacterium]